MIAMLSVCHKSAIADTHIFKMPATSIFLKIKFFIVLSINPKSTAVCHTTERNLRCFEPVQQSVVFRFIERASQKKGRASFLANSMKASAMPSPVSPSWLNRS